jgi:curved DNA-binding protein CbpA
MLTNDEGYASDVPPFPPTRSVFDGPIPTQARRKMLEMAMESLDDSIPDDAGYDLFDALDRHLRALDQQIETSTSFSSVLDEQLSSLEMEYGDESEAVDSQGDDNIFYGQEDAVFYEDPTDFEVQSSESESSVDAAENKNYAVLISRPEPTSEEETNGFVMPRHLEDPQTKNNAHIIGTDSFGFSTIHAEATHSFETYRPKNWQSVAIQHMKGPPPLPDTTDPYELLGFSYHNPPKDADDIRRAYVKRAKKYHPDAIHPASNDQERELAALNFKRINDAYRKLKDEKFRLQDEFFATTMGGAMYEPRGSSRHIRRPFSYGRDFDESESLFSGSYSARHGARYGETRKFWEKRKAYEDYQRKDNRTPRGRENRDKRSPYGARHEVRHNCHVSGEQFPPFFSH